MSRLRVGFIGGGARANQSHYPSVAELSHLAELTAVCDLDSEKLALTAERWVIEARFTDLHEMLAQVELDAVYCIAPPTVLLPIVLPCLEAGKHVFTEKPLGATSDEARQMAEAAEANGCLTMVGFNRRFAPVNRQCMTIIEERGGPTQVIVEYHKTAAERVPYEHLSMMAYDIVHAVDATRWWLGDPLDVFATVRRAWADEDNVFNALMTCEGDASGILSANRASGTRYERVEVHANGVLCVIRAPHRADIWIDGQREPIVITGPELAGTDDERVTYGFRDESVHFLESIRDGVQPQPSFADATRTLLLCERLMEGTL